jgi:OOP family OmpA-OmpF porin
MRLLRLLTFLLAICTTESISLAQSKQPDVLIKMDDIRINCRIIGLDASTIRYRRLNQTTILSIRKSLVHKIIYASGVVSVINTKPVAVVKEEPQLNTPIDNPTTPKVIEKPAPASELDQIIADLEDNKPVKNRKVRLHTILFETNSNRIQSSSYVYLDSIAYFLVKIPTVTIEVSGYTDNTGNASANLRLSQSRANAVRDYLARVMKIAPTQIQAVGYGQTASIAPNNTEQGRARNRRVELTFLDLSNGVYAIQLKNRRRIPVTFLVSSVDNKTISYKDNSSTAFVRIPAADVDFIEYPDGTRRPVGSMQILPDNTVPNNDVAIRNRPLSRTKKISLQVNGLGAYMLGSEFWTSLSAGYGQTIGVGGSAQFDYKVAKPISIGVEAGYLAWNTQVDIVEAPGNPSYYSYRTQTALPFALGHVRVQVGDHFYLMPQGGITLQQLKVSDATSSNSYSSTQPMYGGTVGYLINPNGKVNLDIGLFYRTVTGSKTVGTSAGVDPMQYAGVRLGIGFAF